MEHVAMRPGRKFLKVVLPLAVVAGAIGLAALMNALKPEQARQEPAAVHPKVTVHTVRENRDPIVVRAQGGVRARQQTRLTARVSGHIEWVSQSLYEGGSFGADEALLRLDPLPYASALAEARARLALAEATLMQEREAAAQARIDWQAMGRAGEPGPLVRREPQLMRAQADREAAAAALELAERNLADTLIRAPYAGRVDAKHVDVGQAITAQATILAEIHAADSLEIPVPLSLDEFALIDHGAGADGGTARKPAATLMAEIGGQRHEWSAYLDRTAASVDPQSRMLTAIVRADAPHASARGMRLKPGMFVAVGIEAGRIGRVLAVPRAAVQPGGIVYRLTDDDRLESVPLEIVHTDAEQAMVADGLAPGDRLCLTPLLFFVEGMRVEVTNPPAAP
jgi:RND family efflux transporter MFP subunit